MAQIKLTVSIGTYNRPSFIQKQVRDVLKQLRPGVELRVYDNCSEIPVYSLFNDDELSKFKIYRNEINIGRDQNQVRSLENVSEGWVWTLSDDDEITDDAIDLILSKVDKASECCYINFGNKVDRNITSFHGLMQYFSITGTFGISFFQSGCVYNIEKLRSYIFWFNDFLSSQIGQICMVIKYFEYNENACCLFTTTSLIKNNRPGGWSPLNLIINSSIIIDKYHYKCSELKSTLFKGIGDMYFTALAGMDLSLKDFFYYTTYIVQKLGFINTVRYCFVSFNGHILKRFFPSDIFNAMKRLVSTRYNKKINERAV